jgi:hypothetical protein
VSMFSLALLVLRNEKKSFLDSTSAWMERKYICVRSINSTLGSQQGRDFACTRVQFGHTIFELRTKPIHG